MPGETGETVAAQLRAILYALAAEDPTFRADLVPGLTRSPFEAGEDAGIVQTLRAAAAARLGQAPAWRGEPFWTDCAILADAGIPALMLGADGGGAHAAEEWADEAGIKALADLLADATIASCELAARGGETSA